MSTYSKLPILLATSLTLSMIVFVLSALYFGGLDTFWVDTVITGLTLIHFLVIYIINRKRRGPKLFSFKRQGSLYSNSVFTSVANIVFIGIWGFVWLVQAGVDIYFAILSVQDPAREDSNRQLATLITAKTGIQGFLSLIQSVIFWVLFAMALRYRKARKLTLPQAQDFHVRRAESRHSDAATLIDETDILSVKLKVVNSN